VEDTEGLVDELAGRQRVGGGEVADGTRRGCGGPQQRGAGDAFAEPLRASGPYAAADVGDLLGGEGAVGEQAAALSLPQQGEAVDGFAAMVECLQAAVELAVRRVGEVAGP
jgi:hypothetical protein